MVGKNHRSASLVADYFLLKVSIEGDYIGNLKMQKLCYLAQGWSLALRGTALFDDVIEAWALGPLVPVLFRRFKRYRWHPLNTDRRKRGLLEIFEAEELELLDWIWDAYGHLRSNQLQRLTCAQTPWKEAYGATEFPDPCHEVITPKSMKAYFLTQKLPLRWGAKRAKAA